MPETISLSTAIIVLLASPLAYDLRLVRVETLRERIIELIALVIIAIGNTWFYWTFGYSRQLLFMSVTVFVPLGIAAFILAYYRDMRFLFTLCFEALLCYIPMLIASWACSILNLEPSQYLIFFELAVFLVVLLFVHFVMKDRYVEIQQSITQGWEAFCLVPLFGVACILFVVGMSPVLGNDTASLIGTIVVVLLIATMFQCFQFFKQIEDKYAMENEMQLMRTQHAAEQRIAEERLAHEREQRRLRHDRRHALQLVIDELEAGNTDAAHDHLVSLRGSEAVPQTVYCENTAVNSTLKSWAFRAQDAGVDMVVHANVPAELTIDDLELSMALGNLLENAFEGCMRVERSEAERFINVDINYWNGKLTCQIQNTCRDDIVFEDGMPQTMKNDGGGIGTQSARATVKRHGGVIRYSAQDGVFTTKFVIAA